ncbi:iron-containing alcohol dehydrogenase [Aestuariibacter halophilus]|uniref:Iron-containing alcohol dehydrogenase n=1 Tax=Fluctibacter halophilus TaxID=226011 RepID=A0ABS8G8C9_9ALTE|nr:iron-containing alcohol dehydrogenase [Aestuariibacter halophilus]MCC2616683.1 iron-containing alcohol dehydrogenase [Aestuariibacter halophilus]
MQNFVFHNPTKVVFGRGSIGKLSGLLPEGKRIMLLYGGGSIKKNGVYEQVVAQLDGHQWCEFSGIEANPEFTTLMKAVEQAREQNVDFLLAVGGGSVVDGSKFVAAALKFDGQPWDILAKGAAVKDAVPLGCILTLPATGSETNPAAVVNRSEIQQKRSFISDAVRPQFAILDPEVTYSLPKRQLANGIVDAFVHVMEQYLTYPVGASVQDRFAEGILQNLIELGPQVLDSQDYNVRANLMWNATQALNGLIGVGVPQDWSTHMIGHELTALHGLDHAVTLAIVLPRVMQHQRDAKQDKLLQYAERVWGLSPYDKDSTIDLAIEKTELFFRQMGMMTRLSEHNIGDDIGEAVAAKLRENGLEKLGEHGAITPEHAREIVMASL